MIKNKFPYSKYAAEAQLKIGDVYYAQESFGEAALAYETFRDLHPKHEKVPYAMFRAAKSYQNDIPSNIARDLSPAYKALDSFQDYVKKYPLNPEAAEARSEIVEIKKTLSGKEMLIGNFYFKRKDWSAAKGRYSKVIEIYSDTPHAEEAKKKLTEIGDKKGNSED